MNPMKIGRAISKILRSMKKKNNSKLHNGPVQQLLDIVKTETKVTKIVTCDIICHYLHGRLHLQ